MLFRVGRDAPLSLRPRRGARTLRGGVVGVLRGLVAIFEGRAPDWRKWRRVRLLQWKDDDPRFSDIMQAVPDDKANEKRLTQPPEIVPHFAMCSWADCGRASLRGKSCGTCRKHLCCHILPRYQTCQRELDDDTWKDGINKEVDALLAQVNADKLVRRASVAHSSPNATSAAMPPWVVPTTTPG